MPFAEELNRGMKRSLMVWGLLMGAGVAWAIFDWSPDARTRNVLLVIAIIEFVTVIDRWKGNTLSEALWFLNRRPLVPMLFGVALGMAVGQGLIDPFSAAIGLLYGHFFWQAGDVVGDATVALEREILALRAKLAELQLRASEAP